MSLACLRFIDFILRKVSALVVYQPRFDAEAPLLRVPRPCRFFKGRGSWWEMFISKKKVEIRTITSKAPFPITKDGCPKFKIIQSLVHICARFLKELLIC